MKQTSRKNTQMTMRMVKDSAMLGSGGDGYG